MPADGEEWPMIGQDTGNGLFAGTRPTRCVVEIVPVPDSAELAPTRGVRLDAVSGPAPDNTAAEPGDDAPGDRRSRAFAGWLVDVEEPA